MPSWYSDLCMQFQAQGQFSVVYGPPDTPYDEKLWNTIPSDNYCKNTTFYASFYFRNLYYPVSVWKISNHQLLESIVLFITVLIDIMHFVIASENYWSLLQEAELAREKTNGYKLDRAHIFAVNMFDDFDRFMKVPDEWAPPETKPYTPGVTISICSPYVVSLSCYLLSYFLLVRYRLVNLMVKWRRGNLIISLCWRSGGNQKRRI